MSYDIIDDLLRAGKITKEEAEEARENRKVKPPAFSTAVKRNGQRFAIATHVRCCPDARPSRRPTPPE